MRKFELYVLLAIILIFCNCEDTPDICMEVKPSPVLYLGIDKFDSLNYFRVTKTFSGDGGGTLINSKKWDSIYYSGVDVNCTFNRVQYIDGRPRVVETITLSAIEKIANDKKPGIFLAPEQQLFEIGCNISQFYDCFLSIRIPSYKSIDQYIKLVNKPVFVYPNNSGGGLKILPNDPLIVRWKGSVSSDLRLHLIIESHSNRGISIDTLCYSRFSIEAMDVGFFVTSVLYDNLVSLFNMSLTKDLMITKRTVISVFLEIATATTLLDIDGYRNESYNDYFPILSEGKQTVYGVVYSCATDTLKGLNLHDLTKLAIYSDPNLSDYHFTKW